MPKAMFKAPLLALVALTTAALTAPALAQSDPHQAKKIALVKKLYAGYRGEALPEWDDKMFSPDFNAALEHNAKAAGDDDVGCLGYDFFVQGQDFDGPEIVRTLKVTPAQDGLVKVTFRNFKQPVTLHYKLVCNNKGCAIDDILEPDGSFKDSLRNCLKENFPDVKP